MSTIDIHKDEAEQERAKREAEQAIARADREVANIRRTLDDSSRKLPHARKVLRRAGYLR